MRTLFISVLVIVLTLAGCATAPTPVPPTTAPQATATRQSAPPTASPPAPTALPASPTAVSAPPTATAAPPSSPPPGGGIITNAVLARASTPLTSAPLGITDVFPPDKEIHVNIALADAPEGTNVEIVWTAVDVGSAAPPNTQITSHRSTVQGTRYLDVVFSGPVSLPVGTYKMDIYLNGELNRTLDMQVREDVPAFQTPTPAAVGSCPPPPPPEYRPPLIATGLTMAEGVNTTTFEPINPTREFKPDSTFHAIVELKDTPPNSRVKAVWYALDTGGAEACNTRLNETTVTTSGDRAWFSYEAPDQLPKGIYKVEIYVNDNLNNDVTFRVQ